MARFEPVRWYAPDPDAASRLRSELDVAVVGGGLAGVAAAVVLSERGARVTLVEKGASLGGRAGGWKDRHDDGETFEMERGFHAFFRQYYNVRRLLRRIDPGLKRLVPLEDYPLLGPKGRSESFAGLPKQPPMNLASIVWRSKSISVWQALRVNRDRARAMLSFDPERTYAEYDPMTAKAYLDSLGFPPQARQMLFDVFAHSFFNPEEDFSAAELLMMFHFYFLGNPEGLVFDVLDRPFDTALWRPFAEYLRTQGASIRLNTTVDRVEQAADNRWRLDLDKGQLEADAVVLAVNVPGLTSIVAASEALGDTAWRQSIAGLGVTLPFAVWRLWLDRPTEPGRPPFAGTTGFGCLDNISLYHLFESESRDWAQRTGGSVVELHAYAVPEVLEDASVKQQMLDGLHALFGETRDARIVAQRFLVRRDCPAFPPGSHTARPTVETPSRGILLAGDMVRLEMPSALMERAVASGMYAANRILADAGVAGEEILSVPLRGMMARNNQERNEEGLNNANAA